MWLYDGASYTQASLSLSRHRVVVSQAPGVVLREIDVPLIQHARRLPAVARSDMHGYLYPVLLQLYTFSAARLAFDEEQVAIALLSELQTRASYGAPETQSLC